MVKALTVEQLARALLIARGGSVLEAISATVGSAELAPGSAEQAPDYPEYNFWRDADFGDTWPVAVVEARAILRALTAIQ